MGSSSSKAAGAAARKFPTKPTIPGTKPAGANALPKPFPQPSRNANREVAQSQPQASSTRNAAIDLDASDPDFADSLRSIGPVQPNPTQSPSSAFSQQLSASTRRGPSPRTNPALAILEARSRLQAAAEQESEEIGTKGHEGKQFLDIVTIRQIFVQRDQYKLSAAEIERRMGLKSGVVARLGSPSTVALAQERGRAQKEIEIV